MLFRSVLFVDLHTGLGSASQLHMMPGEELTADQRELLTSLLDVSEDHGQYDLATGGDKGFYPTPGDMVSYLTTLLRPDQKSLALTAEFGTIGSGLLNQIKTLNRLVLENQGFHHGYESEALRVGVDRDFRELFLPTDPQWRRSVLTKSRYVFTKIFKRLDSGTRAGSVRAP